MPPSSRLFSPLLALALVASLGGVAAAQARPARAWKAPADVVSRPPVSAVRRQVGMSLLRTANSQLDRSTRIGERAARRDDQASELVQRAAGAQGAQRLVLQVKARALKIGALAGFVRATYLGRRSERNATHASELLNDPSILEAQ